MKFKRFAMTVIAANLVFTQVASAQFMGGYAGAGIMMNPGMMGTGAVGGGMMTCPYPNGIANGAVSDDDTRSENERERSRLRKLIKQLEKDIKLLERDKSEVVRESFGNFKPHWLTVIVRHMDNGMNCGICDGGTPSPNPGPAPAPPPPIPAPPTPPAPPAPPAPPTCGRGQRLDQVTNRCVDVPVPPAPAPPTDPVPQDCPAGKEWDANKGRCVPKGSSGRTRPKVSANETSSSSRAPASVGGGRAPASDLGGRPSVTVAPVSAGAQIETGGDVWANEPTEYSTLAGSGGYYGGDYGGPVKCYSKAEGRPYQDKTWLPQGGGICRPDGNISASACRISGYNSSYNPKGESACVSGLGEYRRLAKELEELQEDLRIAKEDLKSLQREMRRDRRDGDDDDDFEAGSGRRGGGGGRSPSLLSQLLPVAVGGLAGYLVGSGVERSNKNQYNRAADTWNQLGYPVAPYQSNGYGLQAGLATYGAIAGGMNGAFGCGGMAGGMGGMNPFMNPYMMGGMGGGMYNGFGPWGMAGPWGNGGNMMGYPGMMAGMPGMAGGFGMAGGIGFAGMPGMAGGYAGMPGMMAGGFAGMPGMAGFAGMPGGYTMAGAPGMLAAMAGLSGLSGYAGYPYPAAMAGMSGYPYGLAGQMSIAGMAAGYPGMMAGYPGMMAGMAGGGYAGMMAGMAGGNSYWAIQQANQMGRYQQNSGLMNEYYELMYKMNMMNSGSYGQTPYYGTSPFGNSYLPYNTNPGTVIPGATTGTYGR